jgi:hypothetical protein
MHLITVLIRLALSAVFGIAGVTKLLDQRGTRDAVKNFGSPESIAPALAIVLPIAELAIAAGLLFNSTVVLSGIAALLVLGMFVVAISVNLAQGRTHDCHCSGGHVRKRVRVFLARCRSSTDCSGRCLAALSQLSLPLWFIYCGDKSAWLLQLQRRPGAYR